MYIVILDTYSSKLQRQHYDQVQHTPTPSIHPVLTTTKKNPCSFEAASFRERSEASRFAMGSRCGLLLSAWKWNRGWKKLGEGDAGELGWTGLEGGSAEKVGYDTV